MYKFTYYFIDKLRIFFDKLNRKTKILIAILFDTVLFFISIWLSLSILSNSFQIIDINYVITSLISILIALPIFWKCNLYKYIMRYFDLEGLISIIKAIILYICVNSLLILFLSNYFLSLNLLVMHSLFFVVLYLLIRIFFKSFYFTSSSLPDLKNIMIFGAGVAGRQVSAALLLNRNISFKGFFDDDIELHGLLISGKKVYDSKDIKKIVNEKNIHEIIIAIPTLSSIELSQILKKLKTINVRLKKVPSIYKILSGEMNITDMLEINIEDLLTRDLNQPDLNLLETTVNEEVIAITGAGGSIGSEICRQVLKYKPKKLILIDNSEVSLYNIDSEIKFFVKHSKLKQDIEIIPILASVTSQSRMKVIIKKYKPNIIYHAAAYKHVPLVENNCIEGIDNNILGTINLANIAKENNVKKFIFVSTDKAVRPTNIMGATKRVCEMYLQAFNAHLRNSNKYQTHFSIVRFGNVMGSSGSVIPLFKRQIKTGGPISVTHKDVERYFMTIQEAAQLVIQSTNLSEGGEVFILGMGNRVKIIDLAMKMVELSGLRLKDKANPDGDIEIEFVGLRPGEKMIEELLIDQNFQPTAHPRIIKGNEAYINYEILIKKIRLIEKYIINNNVVKIIQELENIVEGYKSTEDIIL